MSTLWDRIKADAQFHSECAEADRKAQKAADRAREKLSAAEEKEIERHRRAMDAISQKRRAISKDIYSPIYDPLEEAAYSAAEKRLQRIPH